jgi:hypothetical protein
MGGMQEEDPSQAGLQIQEKVSSLVKEVQPYGRVKRSRP